VIVSETISIDGFQIKIRIKIRTLGREPEAQKLFRLMQDVGNARKWYALELSRGWMSLHSKILRKPGSIAARLI
jgi:hypothetical protein